LKKTITSIFSLFFICLLLVKPLSLIFYFILVLFGVYIAIKERLYPFTQQPIRLFSIVTFLFFMTFALSIIFANPDQKNWSSLGRILYFFFAPFLLISLYRANISFKTFLNSVKAGAFLAVTIVWIEHFVMHITGRVSGLYNANTYSDLLALLLMIILANTYRERGRNLLISGTIIILAIGGIVLAGSRGSLLAVGVVVVFYVFMLFWFKIKNRLIPLILVTTVFAAGILGIVFDKNMNSRFNTITTNIHNWKSGKQKSTSTGYRLEMYEAGIEAFKENPIIGYGFNSATKVASKFADKNLSKHIAQYSHLHNGYLTASVNAGIFGLLVLLLILLLPLKEFLNRAKNKNREYIGLTGAIIILTYMVLEITHEELILEYKESFFILSVGFLLFHLPEFKSKVKFS